MTPPTSPPAPASVEDALLRDIVTDPHDVAARGRYADWLTDRDAPGDRERAEFVAVQCEMERRGCVDVWCQKIVRENYPIGRRCELADECDQLQQREEGLLGVAAVQDWSAFPAYVEEWRWRRGFVEEVTLPLAAWLEHGAGLALRCPLAKVTLSDREPTPDIVPGTGDYLWWGRPLGNPDEDHEIPPPLFQLLPGWTERAWYLSYSSRNAALAALSHACLAIVREQAGLPPLPPPPAPAAQEAAR